MARSRSAPVPVRIRQLRPSTDREAVVELWSRALAPQWPVLPEGVAMLRDGFVAERSGRCVGMVGLAVDEGGSILFIAVAADDRGRGIGTQLVNRAVGHLRDHGVARIGIGSGAGPYIWPGVPLDRADAGAFFDALGWPVDHVVTDLVANLRQPGFDEHLTGFVASADVSITRATSEERDSVLAFEDAHFPTWSRWFRDPANEVIAAYDHDGALVGSLLMAGPGPVTMYWPILGEDSAMIGCVGVAPTHEGHGIGSAMVAAASSMLRERGARRCHIGWTQRTSFYQRVGYEPWRRFSMRAISL